MKKTRLLTLTAANTLASLSAKPVVYEINSAFFDDSSTLGGTFTHDASTGIFSNIDINGVLSNYFQENTYTNFDVSGNIIDPSGSLIGPFGNGISNAFHFNDQSIVPILFEDDLLLKNFDLFGNNIISLNLFFTIDASSNLFQGQIEPGSLTASNSIELYDPSYNLFDHGSYITVLVNGQNKSSNLNSGVLTVIPEPKSTFQTLIGLLVLLCGGFIFRRRPLEQIKH